MMRGSAILALGATLLLGHSAEPAPGFQHDAYIWQRAWKPAVDAAIARSAGFVRGWHVLAAEIDPAGTLHPAKLDWPALAATGHPIVAVIRIDGRRDLARTMIPVGLLAGLPIAGVEIDYDCPTSQLQSYARLLRALRQDLPPHTALTITSLPTWLGSAAFAGVIDAVDGLVLQVHAVDDPRAGLFDAAKALAWTREMGRISTKPFLVALPAYQVRVGWDDDGRLASVTGEAPGFAAGETRELAAAPQAIEGFLQDLARDPPYRLGGIAWFRLPVDTDERSWRFETWQAVIDNRALGRAPTIRALPSEAPGAEDLVATNEGTADMTLPRLVPIAADCAFADGVNGYVRDAGGLEIPADRLIHAGETIRIGWQRCLRRGE